MSSDYLGWRQERPQAASRDKDSFDRHMVPGGPATHSYEDYVKNLFHPKKRAGDHRSGLGEKSRNHGISAREMLKMEERLGRFAIADDNDELEDVMERMRLEKQRHSSMEDERDVLKSPLEQLYSELGLKSPELNCYRQYPVYCPKQSSEYFSIRHNPAARENYSNGVAEQNSNSSSFRKDAGWKPHHRQMLVDYKDFSSDEKENDKDPHTLENANPVYAGLTLNGYFHSPLSPYMYRDHAYVRPQDSRIVCSNFVQITSRPKDRFLEKIDNTLAQVRAMPRY